MPTPDYKDDLVFKPTMTWEELCTKWQKYMTYEGALCLEVAEEDDSLIYFQKDGSVYMEVVAYDRDTDECYSIYTDIVRNTTCEEMNSMIDIIDRRCK